MKTELRPEDELFEDIGGNIQRLQEMVETWVQGRNSLRDSQRVELDDYEEKMLFFLWRCRERKLLSHAKIARILGLSRQGLYDKLAKYDYVPDDSTKDD